MVVFLALVCLCLSIYSSNAQLQQVDGCRLSDLSDSNVNIELTNDDNVRGNEGATPVVTIISRKTVCLSVGRTRDRFRSTSEVIIFTGRSSAPTVEQTALVDFTCIINSGVLFWVIDSFEYVFDAAERAALLSDTLQVTTDCSSCSNDALDTNGDNELQHCVRCHSDCLIEEQRLCYGNDENTCCNVYISDVCANECPVNFAPRPSDFECVCALNCMNGGSPLSDCSGCSCGARFTGPLCEDPCDPDQCVEGVCSPGGTFPEFICTCNTGFTGTLCDTRIDPCENVTCSDRGNCRVVSDTDYVCDCDLGFTGTNCETEIDQCVPLPCKNNGVCIRETPFPNFRCQCRPNFSGTLCETCNLPNCRDCSLTDVGMCDVCLSGYLLTRGMCAINCSICDERETQFSKNTCNYYCLLNAWSVDANTQGLSVPGPFQEPISSISPENQFQQIIQDASTVETIWNDAAVAGRPLLAGLQPPQRTGGTLSEWISASMMWISNTIAWLQDIKSEVPDFPSDFEARLQALSSQLDDDPQATYEAVTTVWQEINVEYNRRLSG